MASREPGENAAVDLSALLDRLARILSAQIERHRRLLSCIEKKRQAIRTADIDAITRLCQAEQAIVQRLGDLEKQRLALVGQFTGRLAPDAARPLSLGEIAAAAEPQRRDRLEALAEALRAAMEKVRREIATYHLCRGDMQLTQLAMILGYSELSAFSRSFRRWYGVSPRTWAARSALEAAG